MGIGLRIKQEREKCGITQAELAERAGVTQQFISQLEKEKARATSHVVPIAIALGVNPESLFYDQDQQPRSGAAYITLHTLYPQASPAALSLAHQLLQMSESGSLDDNFIKVLKGMVDNLQKSLVLQASRES